MNQSKHSKNYIQWKGWSNTPFAYLSKDKKRYFDRELLRYKILKDKNLSVLEIGFGNGEFLQYCRSNSWDVSGVEINQFLVQEAKDKGFTNIYLFEEFLQQKNKKYDYIFAFDVLEHVEKNKLEGLFSLFNELLKEGGIFIARFPNGDSPLGLPYQNGDLTHETFIGSGAIKSLANNNSFASVYIGPQATPLFASSPIKTLHNLMNTPFIILLNYLFMMIFFPREGIYFFSKNLIAAFKKYET